MENETKQNETRLSDLLLILKKCWWIMLIALVVSTCGMYAYMKTTHVPQYTAKVSIWALKNADGSGNTVQTQDVSIATYLVNDYKQILVGGPVRERVSQALKKEGKNYTSGQLNGMVSVSHKEETRIITLSIRADSKEEAKLIADTWGTVFDQYLSQLMSGDKMVVCEEALMPNGISNPISTTKAILIGMVIAALIYGIFFLKFMLDDKINSAEDVERYLGLTLLGAIPNKNEVLAKGHRHRYLKGNKYYKQYKNGKKAGQK